MLPTGLGSRTRRRSESRRVPGQVQIIVAVVLCVAAAAGSFTTGVVGDAGYLGVLWAGAILIWWTAPSTDRSRAWRFVAVGIGLWALGGLVSTIVYGHEVDILPTQTVDVLYISGYVPMVVGLADLAGLGRFGRRIGVSLDGLVLFAVLYGLLWFAVVQHRIDASSLARYDAIVTSIYPAGDLALLLMSVQALLGPYLRRRVAAGVTLGMALMAVADTALLMAYLDNPEGEFPLVDLSYLLGVIVVVAAALDAGSGRRRMSDGRGQLPLDRDALVAGMGLLVPPLFAGYRVLTDEPLPNGAFVVWLLIVALLVVARMAVLLRDLVRAQRQLGFRATHDHLTGLPDRQSLVDWYDAQPVVDRSGGVLVLNIDDVESVTADHGHAVGDQLLAAVAERIGVCVESSGSVARLGGAQFVVFIRRASVARAVRMASEIRASVSEPIELRTDDVAGSGAVTVVPRISIGTSQVDGTVIDLTSGIRRADRAMRQVMGEAESAVALDEDLLPGLG